MFNPEDDFPGVFDGTEAVTLRRPGEAPRAVAHAVRQTTRGRDSGGASRTPAVLHAVWHLPAAEVDYPLRPSDKIVDAEGMVWTIVEATPVARGTRWRCAARRPSPQGPDQVVDVEKAEYEIGVSGAETVRWNTWKTAVPAVICPAASVDGSRKDGGGNAGALEARASWRAVLADPLPDEGVYRIRVADGTLYRIVAWKPLAAVAAPAALASGAGVELELVAWQ
jgi:hypothetical protein